MVNNGIPIGGYFCRIRGRLIESTKSVFSLAEIGVIKLKHNPIETKPTIEFIFHFLLELW